jgi:hypothetical protein
MKLLPELGIIGWKWILSTHIGIIFHTNNPTPCFKLSRKQRDIRISSSNKIQGNLPIFASRLVTFYFHLLTIQSNRDVRFSLYLPSSFLACLNLESKFSSQVMVTDEHTLTMSSGETLTFTETPDTECWAMFTIHSYSRKIKDLWWEEGYRCTSGTSERKTDDGSQPHILNNGAVPWVSSSCKVSLKLCSMKGELCEKQRIRWQTHILRLEVTGPKKKIMMISSLHIGKPSHL